MLKKYNRTNIYVGGVLFFSIGMLIILNMRNIVHVNVVSNTTSDTGFDAVSDTAYSLHDTSLVNFSNLRTGEQHTFTYILADTEALREKGLSGRASLGDKEVMLFTFEKPDAHFFWMKDMLFPIDIVWLDSNKKVIHIEHQVTPQTYPKSFGPTVKSLYVSEFNADTAKSIDLRVGDTVEF